MKGDRTQVQITELTHRRDDLRAEVERLRAESLDFLAKRNQIQKDVVIKTPKSFEQDLHLLLSALTDCAQHVSDCLTMLDQSKK